MRAPDWLKAAIPRRHKARLREWQRRYVLGRGMRGAAKSAPGAEFPEQVVNDLTFGWGNEGNAAKLEFIHSIVRHSWRTRGPILECGSGLSTLIAGAIAQRIGNRIWSLENDPFWADHTASALAMFGIECVTVCLAPARNFGDYNWYDTAPFQLPEHIALVICDGPPGDTHGGRYGLLPKCFDRFDPECTILLDDAQRAGEQAALERWKEEFGTRHEIEGTDTEVACIHLSGSRT